MEDLGWRFSLISQKILNHVDDNSLANFRKASREIATFWTMKDFTGLDISKSIPQTLKNFKNHGRG